MKMAQVVAEEIYGRNPQTLDLRNHLGQHVKGVEIREEKVHAMLHVGVLDLSQKF